MRGIQCYAIIAHPNVFMTEDGTRTAINQTHSDRPYNGANE